ncbi:MAG: anthranilate synthase component I family protein [Prevotella sp.]|nr:anthranilate synthase component I family protein [Prevotella sp.]
MNKTFKYHTVTRTILADFYTPVGVYMRLRDICPQSALMESSDYHGNDNSRSFIGVHPMASIAVSHGNIVMTFPDGEKTEQHIDSTLKGHAKRTVAQAVADFVSSFHVEGEGKEYCGLYGYTSFNAVRYFEDIDVEDGTMEENDAPDILYILYRDVIVFDHFNNTLQLVSLTLPESSDDEAPLDALMRAMNSHAARAYGFHPVGESWSTLSDEEHKANIRRCVSHCLRGDVFQIVISRRFIQKFEGDDFKLYRALRSINPSPYLFYFDFGGFRIFGSSPETHNRIVGNKAYIDPIAGTARRTGDREQDRRNAEFLRNDPKENAEHVMLVDLARNDLSRNCHGVRVDFYKDMQFYSHVIHLVSRVSGEIDLPAASLQKEERHRQEVLKKISTFIDTFPAGTLSGAPKVRAMQIISGLEPHNRGAYGGCIGFIGLNGDLNQAIVIRTFISRNSELWFQAGSGVVAKSSDTYELEECNNKLGALVQAVKAAERM